jgi:hypothetical protein
MNPSTKAGVYFLQLWIQPAKLGTLRPEAL